MWCSPYPAEAGWAIEMVSQWNRSHPGIQVRLQKIPGERVAEDVLRDAIRAHKTPDVCAHMFPVNVHEFVKMGGLLPLDSYRSLLAASERRSGAHTLSLFRSSDGKIYQIPWKCNPIMVQYNSGLLRQAGVQPPRTYSQFLAAAAALRKRGVYAWAPNPTDKWFTRYYDFYPLYLAASGGRPFLDGSGRPAFNNAAAVSVMSFLGTTFRNGYAPTRPIYADAPAQNEAFASGKLAFLVTGPWNAPLITEIAGKTVQFGFIPVPVPDNARGPVYTYGNFRNISVFSTCRHPREAALLVEFLISKQADLAFMEATSELPYRPSLLTDRSFAAQLRRNPYLIGFARQLPYVRSVENTQYFNRILNAIAKQYVLAAVRGSKSAAQAIRDASDEVVRMVSGR
jgi:multiple sugar transport system substrate-binding protein